LEEKHPKRAEGAAIIFLSEDDIWLLWMMLTAWCHVVVESGVIGCYRVNSGIE